MADNKKKVMVLNTLLFVFCVVVIAIFCFMPAKQIEVLDTYKVNFDSNGGSAIAAIEIEEGKEVAKPEEPTREGYIFVGWMLGDELYDFSQGINGDITLKAGWQEVEPDKIYFTVSFNSDGGTTYGNQIIEEGKLATNPGSPTKNGYNFLGWQLNGVDYDFNTPITKDITINAIYEKIPEEKPDEPEEPEKPTEDEKDKVYTVKFDSKGGNAISSQKIKSGEQAKKPTDPTKKGYLFKGWQLNGKNYNFSSKVTKNITLVAKWELLPPVQVNVTLDYNGGTAGKCPTNGILQVDKGTLVSKICKPVKEYYQFTGWGLPSTATINSTASLKAQWKVDSFKVTCSDKGDGATTMNCALIITDTTTGKTVSPSAIYALGKIVPGNVINKAFFNNDKLKEVTFDVDGIKGLVAKK